MSAKKLVVLREHDFEKGDSKLWVHSLFFGAS